MHILLIIEGTYPWYRGGVSEWVFQYLKNLPQHRFSILQIATDEFQGLDPSKALYPLTKNIDEFVRISPPEMSGDHDIYLNNWFSEISGTISSLRDSFDVLHVTNTGFAGWLGARLSQQMATPLLLTEHAIYWKEVEMGAVALECGYKIPDKPEELHSTVSSFKEFASFTYSEANQVVTVSKSNISFQEKLGAQNIKYIPNGIPKDWLISRKERGSNPVIAWVGRCAEMKNPLAFFDLIDAFKDLKVAPSFKMLLSDANEEGLANEVKAKSQSYPELECIWNESAKKYFSDFDFLSITSHNESQPLVMLEALAHQALPVGLEVGDLTNSYGMVFNAGVSFNKIASEIENLWADKSAFNTFVFERFSRVKEKHIWEEIFYEYDHLLLGMTELEALSTSE